MSPKAWAVALTLDAILCLAVWGIVVLVMAVT